jgi:uncharacterized cupin superfamily protein
MRCVNLAGAAFEEDPDDPEGFISRRARLGPLLGATDTGASLYELPPGQAICPYHYEYGEEEWALVVSGRPSVRTPDGTTELRPLDMVFFPKGPEGAHQIRNDAEETAQVLLWSTVVYPTATAYPDSGKVGVYTGQRAEDLIVERANAVDYFHGETG